MKSINRSIKAAIGLLFVCSILVCPLASRAQLFPGTQAPVEEEKEIIEDALGRTSPEGTVRGFLSAVGKQDYLRASRYLNLQGLPVQENAHDLARALQKLLNAGKLLPYTRISNNYEGSTGDDLPAEVDKVGTISIDGQKTDVLVERVTGEDGDEIWLFSSETLALISLEAVEGDLLIGKVLGGWWHSTLLWGIPVGHWLVALLLLPVSYLLAWIITALVNAFIPRVYKRAGVDPIAGIIKATLLPVRLYLAVWLFVFLSREIGLSIILRQLFSILTAIVGLIAVLLLLWRLTEFITGFSQKKMTERGSPSGMSIVLFLQRAAKISIIIIGIISVMNAVGIDITAGLAALGIGGIALALGAQKSMENLVGSITLIADQPLRVGDFCRIGDLVGTVESIGMRSTRIKTLARTVVTVPNGELSSARIENFAHRDKFWFNPKLNFRYETSPDQIRYLLQEIRSLLYAHPKVLPDPARIRFTTIGTDSLDLDIFAYFDAASFDEYLEIQEDLLLRIMDTVEKSGTTFAFPSRTIYFGRDSGLSKEKSEAAEATVEQWRKNNEIQMPQFDEKRIENLRGSISYPPEGSVKRQPAS